MDFVRHRHALTYRPPPPWFHTTIDTPAAQK
jgi:hypothetical protein